MNMMEILLEIITKKLGYHIITLICQNHLSYDAGGSITITYAAAGIKLKKEVQGPENYTLHYIGGIEYREEAEIEIESIHHAEGRVTYDENDEAVYEYHLKDHLGNVRMAFADKDGDGDGYIEPFNVNPNEPNSGDDGVDWNLTETEILQESHYYPFGMAMDGAWQDIVNGPENNYLYNGKELNSDFDLNWSDYGARYYDAAIGRWNSVDPLAETTPSWNGYNYVENTPINAIDPDGLSCVGCGKNNEDFIGDPSRGFTSNAGGGDNNSSSQGGTDPPAKGSKENPVQLPTVSVTASAPKNLWKMGGNYMTQDEVFNAADVNPWLEKKILRGGFDSNYSDPIGRAYMRRHVKRSIEEFNYEFGMILASITPVGEGVGLLMSGYGRLGFMGLTRARGGYGLFGAKGFNIGRTRVDLFYRNPRAGVNAGTIFSIQRGVTKIRLDYGPLHNIRSSLYPNRLHSTLRVKIFGKTYGSSAQRTWYPPFSRIKDL
jgi:RHS repeat-associated protein